MRPGQRYSSVPQSEISGFVDDNAVSGDRLWRHGSHRSQRTVQCTRQTASRPSSSSAEFILHSLGELDPGRVYQLGLHPGSFLLPRSKSLRAVTLTLGSKQLVVPWTLDYALSSPTSPAGEVN
ncbi:unnamed protein product [Lota lota]